MRRALPALSAWLLGALALGGAPGCGGKEGCSAAAEQCNGQDDDCDGEVDEDLPQETWYSDGDGDGYGSPLADKLACQAPAGAVDNAADCDDTDAEIRPGAAEICDGADNDCDGLADAADGGLEGGRVYYYDADGDGFGAEPALYRCEPAAGYTEDGGDCDDGEAAVSPSAEEICGDDLDNDCDGAASGCPPLEGEYTTADAPTAITGADGAHHGRWLSGTDLDGDGANELITSDPDIGGEGAIYAFSGLERGVDADVAGAATLEGRSSAPLGYSAIGVPDVTGDGLGDILSFYGDNLAVFAGPLGGSGIGSAAATFTGFPSSPVAYADQLAAGDFDGDGVADLLVGDPLWTDSADAQGAAWVLLGPLSGESTWEKLESAGSLITGAKEESAYLGWDVSRAGDVDGDGDEEILLSAPYQDLTVSSYTYAGAGCAFLLDFEDLTPAFSVQDATAILYHLEPSAALGHDLAAAGDVDGDGLDDVLVGAPYAGGYGQAWLFSGPIAGIGSTDAATTTFGSESGSGYLGWQVAGAGDLDADGRGDVAVTQILGRDAAGAVLIAYGPTPGKVTDLTADAVIYGASSGAYVGHDVAGVGDLDGDGAGELGIGAYDQPHVWLFYGGGL